jgi:arabinose-5-phosphate isomerase
MPSEKCLSAARDALAFEANSIEAALTRLNSSFATVMDILLVTEGRIVVTGLGKSGLIGQKIVATLCSTGSPAIFMHASDALHGDLGSAKARDVLLAISYSGETIEVLQVAGALRLRNIKIVSMVGRPESSLAAASDAWLDISVVREADPEGIVPTASTAVTLALGDALAIGLMVERGYSSRDFAQNHPGGSLGQQLRV